VGNSVKGTTKVQVDNIRSLSLIHYAGHLVTCAVSLQALDERCHTLKYPHVVPRAPKFFLLGDNYCDSYKGRMAGIAIFILEHFGCKHFSACGQASTMSLRCVVGSGEWWEGRKRKMCFKI